MPETDSNEIRRQITPAERTAIAAAFARAYAAAKQIVQRTSSAMERSMCTPEVFKHRYDHQQYLDEILAGVTTIGTPEFEEHPVLTDTNAIPGLDIRIDWSILLLAWCRSWAHTVFLDPEDTSLESALDMLETYIVHGMDMDADFVWTKPGYPVSTELMLAIFHELSLERNLVGRWQVLCYDVRASKMLLEARPPRCSIPFRCEFSLPVVQLEDGAFDLVSVYNARLEEQAAGLERQAAEMVEEAVQRSMPLRANAANLRAKMK